LKADDTVKRYDFERVADSTLEKFELKGHVP